MKKILSVFFVLILAFSLSSCGKLDYKNLTDSQIDSFVESGELGELYAHYSVMNKKDSDELYVQFDSALENEKYYSKTGTAVQFYGKKAIYNQNGEEVDFNDISVGDRLVIIYDMKIYDDNPVTIKAVKVILES